MKSTLQHGFTLTELLISLTILALAGTLAFPAYRDWQSRLALQEASAGFVAAAHAARSHALATGHDTLVQALDGNWNTGWRIYADTDSNGEWDSETETLLQQRAATPGEVAISAPATATGNANTLQEGYLLFNGQGFARNRDGSLANGTLEFRLRDRLRAVVFYRTGRIRTCDDDACG